MNRDQLGRGTGPHFLCTGTKRALIWSRCAFGKGSMRDQNNTFRSGNEGVFEGEEVARSSGRCEKEARCDRDRARAWHRGLPDGVMSAFDASEAVRLITEALGFVGARQLAAAERG